MNIALISCTKKKETSPCTAKDMYRPSALFQKAKTYVGTKEYDGWYILSALHGLLEPEQVIEPYNISLNTMSAKDIRGWSERVALQLKEIGPTNLDFYAGDNYRKNLIPLLEQEGIACNVPLRGKGIGEQLQFYNEELKAF